MWEDGVIRGFAAELKATSPKTQTLRLEPGGAIVCGLPYQLTAALDFRIPLPTKGATSWVLALHADWEEQTIIAIMLSGCDGDLREPTLHHLKGEVWDLPLYAGRITVEGEVSILPKWFYSDAKP